MPCTIIGSAVQCSLDVLLDLVTDGQRLREPPARCISSVAAGSQAAKARRSRTRLHVRASPLQVLLRPRCRPLGMASAVPQQGTCPADGGLSPAGLSLQLPRSCKISKRFGVRVGNPYRREFRGLMTAGQLFRAAPRQARPAACRTGSRRSSARRAVSGDRADAGAGEGGRPGEDGLTG